MKNSGFRHKMTGIVAGLFGSFIFASVNALAWGDGGHMMVATIAQDRLNKNAKAEADRLLAVVISPASISMRTATFVTAAHWADDVRPLSSFAHTGDLHFIDNPFSPDGTELPADLPKPENVVKALDQNVAILKNSQDDQEKAQALRFIIHFVGDIHQPLHCATRVTSALPEGDRGGNEFFITGINGQGKKQKLKLHSYWDEGIGTFPRTGPHFQPPPVEEVTAAAKAVLNKFPDSDEGWKSGVPFGYEQWAAESSAIAENFVYKGLVAGQMPSQEYVDAATATAQKRVAWAGFRLAALLNAVWPETP